MSALGIAAAVFVVTSCAVPPSGGSVHTTGVEPPSSEQTASSQKYPTTTTSAPTGLDEEASETPQEQVNFEGRSFDCEETGPDHWACERLGKSIYCSGIRPTECSETWYPDEFESFRLVVFQGGDYVCEKFGTPCIAYRGGPPPTNFAWPDVWCEGLTCSDYDPARWFELTYDFDSFICEDSFFGFQHFDCYQTLSGFAPTVSPLDPDLFCSGSKSFLDCSENWYPDDLAAYEFVSLGGQKYLCERAMLGSYGDYDCGVYTGGDPNFTYTHGLKCTDIGYTFKCDPDFYPSELEDVSFVTISGSKYVCQDSYGGSECFRYYGGSPASEMYGLPDLYCNYSGLCDPYGYP